MESEKDTQSNENPSGLGLSIAGALLIGAIQWIDGLWTEGLFSHLHQSNFAENFRNEIQYPLMLLIIVSTFLITLSSVSNLIRKRMAENNAR